MLLDRDVDCDKAIIGGVDAERRARMAAVAGTRRNIAGLPISLEVRGEGGIGGFLHCDSTSRPCPVRSRSNSAVVTAA